MGRPYGKPVTPIQGKQRIKVPVSSHEHYHPLATSLYFYTDPIIVHYRHVRETTDPREHNARRVDMVHVVASPLMDWPQLGRSADG